MFNPLSILKKKKKEEIVDVKPMNEMSANEYCKSKNKKYCDLNGNETKIYWRLLRKNG